MTRSLPLAVLLSAATVFAGAGVLEQYAANTENIRSLVPNVLLGGLDNGPRVAEVLVGKAPKAIPPQARAALVVAALDLVKATVATPAVRDRLVEAAAGEPPRDPREEFQELEADLTRKIEEAKALDLNLVPAAQRKELAAIQAQSQAMMKKTLADQRAALPEATKRYEAERAAWEKSKQPGDVLVNAALKKALGEFLAGTEGMPWGAKLVKQQHQQLFADARLEAKPSWWKACFRAGKEPVEAARAYVKKWLAELK